MSAIKACAELKPCPFCGSADVGLFQYTGRGQKIECRSCRCSGYFYGYDKGAIAGWNRRAELPKDGQAAPGTLGEAMDLIAELKAAKARVAQIGARLAELSNAAEGQNAAEPKIWKPGDYVGAQSVIPATTAQNAAKDAPERIYLQDWPAEHHAATWCADQISDDDVEYVRTDLVAAKDEGRELLLAARAHIDDWLGRTGHESTNALLRRISAHLAAQPVAAEGFVMAPKKLTQEMLEAALAADDGDDDILKAIENMYDAMIDAALKEENHE